MFGQGFNYGFLGKPLCFTDTTDIFKDNSGVALYTLDYDGSDAGGASGNFGESAVLIGTSSQINFPNIPLSAFDAAAVSVSLWVNMQAVVSGYSSGSYVFRGRGNWIIQVISSGIVFQKYDTGPGNNGNNDLSYNFSGGTNLNQWYHIVVTDNGTSTSGLNLYVDGVLRDSNSGYANIDDNSWLAGIANYAGRAGGNFKVDQLRIFNKEISSSEVTTLYNETKNTTNTLQVLGDTSCIATYTFDGSSTDLSGNYNGTDTNILYKYDGTPTNVDFGVGGKSLYGARFNGSNSAIIVPNNILASNNHSISTWFYLNDTSGIQTLIEFDYGNRIIFRVASTDSNWAYIGSSGYFNHGISFSAGQWYHLAITFSAGNPFKIYVNGNLSYTGGNTNLYLRTVDNIIGAGNSSGANGVDGTIDQVRLFNKALSAAEISKLYGNGAGEIACKYTATTTDNYFPLADGSSDVVAYIPFDNSAEDLISGDFGTLGSGTEFRFGRFGQAVVGNQNTWSADFPNISETANSPFSVSCWVNIADRNSTIYFFLWSSGFGSSSAWGGLLSGQSGKYYTNFGNQVLVSSASVVPPLNQWFHYVLTYDGTNVKVYSDTEKVIDGNINTGALASNNLKVLYNGSSSEAKIDQVRIYDAALSSNQVTQLYNEKPEVDTSNFKAVLYEGTGANEYISNVGFEPDLVWLKCRNVAKDHRIYDSVRGATKFLEANNTDAEATASTSLTSFDSNGFTLGAASTTNSNNDTFIGWCWKGGGAAVPNTDGTITSQVSANTAAGFSIIKTAGGNSSAGTVGHGLNSAPEMVITKGIDNSAYWWIYHSHLNGGVNPEQYGVRFSLNGDSAQYDASSGNLWNNTAPTNSVISLGGSTVANPIIYAFHSVSGYSKIGTYTGNTSSTNTINVGFAPSFLMIKRTDSSGSWRMYDRERDSGNLPQRIDHNLAANSNGAEYDATSGSTGYAWFSSTGFYFETNQTNSDINANGGTYIYMAFK